MEDGQNGMLITNVLKPVVLATRQDCVIVIIPSHNTVVILALVVEYKKEHVLSNIVQVFSRYYTSLSFFFQV